LSRNLSSSIVKIDYVQKSPSEIAMTMNFNNGVTKFDAAKAYKL
jgi:hypothetical protein